MKTVSPVALLGAVWLVGLLVSGWAPFDRPTWILEVFPVLIAYPVLWATQRRFPLTTLLYVLIGLHGLILMLGGAYTYARVPLGFWMQDWFGFARNDYDKIGHFAQGFVPAMVAREVLIRRYGLGRHRYMLAFLCVAVCLGISAFYELIEWWTALALGQGADQFLGTQGDPWDTQSDMFMALIGATAALVLLTPVHERELRRVQT
jgi:putative membrane protein